MACCLASCDARVSTFCGGAAARHSDYSMLMLKSHALANLGVACQEWEQLRKFHAYTEHTSHEDTITHDAPLPAVPSPPLVPLGTL